MKIPKQICGCLIAAFACMAAAAQDEATAATVHGISLWASIIIADLS